MKPSTVETIRDQLEFQRRERPSWIEHHFPNIAERGTPVTYDDVESMTEAQVDSVRHLLATEVLYGRKIVRKRKAAAIGFLRDGQVVDDEWAIRVKLIEEALADLCSVYGLAYPL